MSFKLVPLIIFVSVVAGYADDDKKWKLSWSDEFDFEEIDKSKWGFSIGNGFYNYETNQWISGWGNNELQYYTKSNENVFVKDGHLSLRAIKETYQTYGYTSAKIQTKSSKGVIKFSQKYGKVEVRAKLPEGQGLWPAIWMLPAKDEYGSWAASGEIDIMEAKGEEPMKVNGTIHYGGPWPVNSHAGASYAFPDGENFTDFHTYSIEWIPGEIKWFVDGKLYARQNNWWSSSQKNEKGGVHPKEKKDLNSWPAPFDQEFYIIMNLAVGGNYVAKPNSDTVFPAEMLIDYVRVYSYTGDEEEVKKRKGGDQPF